MRTAALVLLACVLGCGSSAPGTAAEGKTEIVGEYTCTGKNPNGTAYEGKVKITKKGDHYMLSWTHDGGFGVAILEGNVLSSSYANKSGASGVVVYKIEKGGKGPKLVGQYIPYPGDGKLWPETLEFSGPN